MIGEPYFTNRVTIHDNTSGACKSISFFLFRRWKYSETCGELWASPSGTSLLGRHLEPRLLIVALCTLLEGRWVRKVGEEEIRGTMPSCSQPC